MAARLCKAHISNFQVTDVCVQATTHAVHIAATLPSPSYALTRPPDQIYGS